MSKDGLKLLCREHSNVFLLFCVDESRELCPACEFFLHNGHHVVEVEPEVSRLKELLKSDLQALQKEKGRVESVENTYKELYQHSQKQEVSCEYHIRVLFTRLRQFLKEEEDSRLAVLREEHQRQAQTMRQEMNKISKQLASLTERISNVEDQLQRDSMEFLKEYKQSRVQAQTSQPNPRLVAGLLLNQAKVLGNMGFMVWKKMRGVVPYSSVILDPNTVNAWLSLSEELTSVTRGDTYQQVPDNPERFTKTADVLGSEGFSSGKHHWVVEVGDYPEWNIGVVSKSVERKRALSHIPDNGYWCLERSCGEYSDPDGNDLKLKQSPQRIQVQLDYDKGKVLFYNAENMSLICSYTATFTETLFPYFNVGEAGNAKTKYLKVF